MRKSMFRKGLVVAVIVLFVGVSVIPSNASFEKKHSFRESNRNGIDDGLVGFWSFDEGSGNIAHDYSGFENNGTVNGAAWTTGISDYALDFDGVDDYVDMGNPSSVLDFGVGEFTEGYWIYPYSFTGGIDGHVQLDVTSPPSRLISGQYGNTLYVYTNDGNWHDTGKTVNVNEWSYIVWVKSGNVLKLYINGTYSGWSMSHTTSLGPVFSMYIGRHSTDIFHGIIDEVRMYNRSLNETEIQTLYSNPGGNPIIVYVDDDYNESTPGWGYDHFDKIQYGIDAVNESGTAYVYNGTYNENVNINKDGIILIGESELGTIINSDSGTSTVTINNPNVQVSNFTISKDVTTGDALEINPGGDYTTIENCTLKDGDQAVNIRNGVIYTTITYCDVRDSDIRGILTEGDYLTVTYSDIHDNIGIGIRLAAPTNNCNVYSNNFYNNTGDNAEDDSFWNKWDNGVDEGNYWDDYTGEDSNGDGIGDIPYNISGGSNQDLYPLMRHFELYFILDIILENSEVDEGTDFNVVIKSEGGTTIPNAIVEFNDELKITGLTGTVHFTAPQVGEDTYYNITATKEGYTGDTETILIKDVPVEFVSVFMFGRITNLDVTGEYITFNAVNVRVIKFSPFQFTKLTSGEKISIYKDFQGYLGALLGVQFIFAKCDASIG